MKYKMSDLFELPVYGLVQITTAGNAFSVNGVEIRRQHQAAITHAINNHDRLTAQVEELKAMLKQTYGPVRAAYKQGMDCGPNWTEFNELLTRTGEDNDSIQ